MENVSPVLIAVSIVSLCIILGLVSWETKASRARRNSRGRW